MIKTLFPTRVVVVHVLLGLTLAYPARAQQPTIDPRAGEVPGAGSSLGRTPGALGGLNTNEPQQSQPITGAMGASGTRAPSSISNTPQPSPANAEVMRLPTPLQLPAPPTYGTLDFPTLGEDMGPPGGLTLDEAIERLVRDNLQLRGQFLEISQADADILTASLRSNPVLYADAQLVPYGSYSRERPGGPVQYDVNISYPLDITRKRIARTAVADRAKRTIELQFQDEVRRQIGNLTTVYVGVLASRQRLRYAGASLEGLDEILKPLGEQESVGRITAAEVNRVRLQRETAALLVNDAQEALRQARRELATLLNLPGDDADLVDVRGAMRVETPEPPTTDELVQIALGARPDLQAFRMGIHRAEAEVKLARANRLNDVYLLLQPYTFQDNAPFGLKSATSWAVGVTVPLPIYNRNQGNIRRAQINVVQTQLELENLARRVVTDVQVAEREYKVSRAALEHIDMNLRPAAEQVLSTVKRQYDEGSIDVIAFISARQEYNQVVRQYLDTLIRYRQSMYALNTAVGQRIFP